MPFLAQPRNAEVRVTWIGTLRSGGLVAVVAFRGLVVSGCAGDDTEDGAAIIDVQVNGALPGAVVFSWGGSATELEVLACGEGCAGLSCGDGHLSGNPNCSSSGCFPTISW